MIVSKFDRVYSKLSFFFFLEDPKHERSLQNLDFYAKAWREQMKKIKGDNELEGASNINIQSLYEIKNPRPEHPLGLERDRYEALCRGEHAQVTISFKTKAK